MEMLTFVGGFAIGAMLAEYFSSLSHRKLIKHHMRLLTLHQRVKKDYLRLLRER